VGYIGNVNITDRIGEAELMAETDHENTGAVNNFRVNQAIDYASGIFDAYVPTAYRRPISATPMIVSINLDLALYDLWKDKAESDEGRWKVRKAAHDDAIRLLQAIAAGKAKLDSPFIEIATSTNPTPGFFFGVLRA
jgi:phage gp36-like protein